MEKITIPRKQLSVYEGTYNLAKRLSLKLTKETGRHHAICAVIDDALNILEKKVGK